MKRTILSILLLALCVPAFAAQDAVLAFYQRQALMKGDSSRADRAFAADLARQANLWARQHASSPELKTALLMQADYYLRAREDAHALVAMYQIRFFFPSAQDLTLLSSNVEQAMDNLDRGQKGQALKMLAINTEGKSREEQYALLLETLVKGNLKDTYQPVNDLFDEFFVQYPNSKMADKLTLLQGDWHRQNENYNAAVTAYKKVNELFSNTPYKAASLRMTADVYAGDLEDYETATAIYNQVLKQYPTSSEIGVVYKHLAMMEENRKEYAAALAWYDKAIADLGSQPVAYEAWRGKADVQVKMKEYKAAYNTLLAAAQVFSADENKYVDSLQEAAEVAQRRLKDLSLRAAALEKIMLAYPKTQKAPQVLYDLGYSYEKAGKPSQAAETYKRLIINYPTDNYASRAQSRLSRLEK